MMRIQYPKEDELLIAELAMKIITPQNKRKIEPFEYNILQILVQIRVRILVRILVQDPCTDLGPDPSPDPRTDPSTGTDPRTSGS
jgi:hypothetical protein